MSTCDEPAGSASGTAYRIFERALTPAQTRTFQAQLQDMKFLERDASEKWDDSARQAVSAYAEYRGAEYRFSIWLVSRR